MEAPGHNLDDLPGSGLPLRTTAIVVYVTLAVLALAIPQAAVNRLNDFSPGPLRDTALIVAQAVADTAHRIGFDIDPVFNNTEEWYAAIPAEVRPRKDQPFYHLFAENAETEYIAYVSEQNLLPDESGEPVRHPQVKETFERRKDGSYRQRDM